jgi:Peptidase family C25
MVSYGPVLEIMTKCFNLHAGMPPMFRISLRAAVAVASLTATGLIPIGARAQTDVSDKCPRGLVWREQNPGDHVCVTPEVRAKIRADNKRAASPPAATDPAPQRDAAGDPFLGVTGPRPFLIIAPDAFMAALEPLVAHKKATGMPALAVSIAQLTAHFEGADDPEKIKRGIQYAQEHLGTQYVMLVGDAHWFPVRFIFFRNFSRAYPGHPDRPNLPVDGVFAPSDLYYANLYHHRIVRSPELKAMPGPFDDWDADRNGHYNEADWGTTPRANWNNPNPDRVDGYPDVAVARVTARSAADVTLYVNKIIRYETQRPKNLLFTFVADGIYPDAPSLVDPIVAKSHLTLPSAFLLINKPDPHASSRWSANASPADVASKINMSVWVGYLGHGSINSWDGRGFGRDLVKLTDTNDALPFVFTDGCVTGRFAVEAPFDYDYIDVSGKRHKFVPAPGADPDNRSVPAMIDKISGEKWGSCAGCSPLPLVTPPPNPYDFDRGPMNFAYPWLFGSADGGAIAYFGEVGVMEPQMAAELETYMLTDYVRGQRNLGAIYLHAEQEYWKHHIDDPGNIDRHSPSRLYLGFGVMFGDPSLRMR